MQEYIDIREGCSECFASFLRSYDGCIKVVSEFRQNFFGRDDNVIHLH